MFNNFLGKNFIYLLCYVCLYIYVPEFPRIGILNWFNIYQRVYENMLNGIK